MNHLDGVRAGILVEIVGADAISVRLRQALNFFLRGSIEMGEGWNGLRSSITQLIPIIVTLPGDAVNPRDSGNPCSAFSWILIRNPFVFDAQKYSDSEEYTSSRSPGR